MTSHTGYTHPVKIAVSIPDDVFADADRAAATLGWSRSRLYTQALRRFLDEQGDDPVTAALDDLADQDEFGPSPNPGAAQIAAGQWQW